MKIYNKVIINIETNEVVYEDSFEYDGEVAQCFGGKDSEEESDNTVRFAPYLEKAHSKLLDHEGSDEPIVSFIDAFNATICKHPGFGDDFNEDLIESPYSGYEVIDIDEGYFGIRTDDPSLTYEMKNYPSLWDMFGKFMAGLDVHDLWGQIYEDVIQGPEIENAVVAQSALLQDDIDTMVMPKFLAGMRDINSVQSTTFVIGKAIIQGAHVKSINKFSSQIRMHALSISNEQWANHLKWDESVIRSYTEMFKLYYASRLDMDRTNLEYPTKDLMWNVNLFENARAILGAMSGSAATVTGNEPSQASKAIGGAMMGAAGGAMVGGGPGAVIGGVLGFASSFL